MMFRKIDATYICHACSFSSHATKRSGRSYGTLFGWSGSLSPTRSIPTLKKQGHLTLDLENSLSKTANVLAGNTSNANTTVLGRVDRVLLSKLRHLLSGQAGVGEHADLAGDVAPVVLAAELLEVVLEQGAHLDDAVGHALDFAQPLLVQCGVVQNRAGDACAVHGRVGVQGAHEDLDLRVDALGFFGGGGDDGEGADALAVEALGWGVSLTARFRS
jgi:hypothetical protein